MVNDSTYPLFIYALNQTLNYFYYFLKQITFSHNYKYVLGSAQLPVVILAEIA